MSEEVNTTCGPAVSSEYGPVLLSRLFVCDPLTGILTWKRRDISICKNKHAMNAWNAKNAGKSFGGFDTCGYLHGGVFGRKMKAHRIVFAMATGLWPSFGIDHDNRVKDDNRISNLFDRPQAQNCRNLSMHKGNTSGITGVTWNKREMGWQAQIGRNAPIGIFPTIQEASDARKLAEITLGFHPNHGVALQ